MPLPSLLARSFVRSFHSFNVATPLGTSEPVQCLPSRQVVLRPIRDPCRRWLACSLAQTTGPVQKLQDSGLRLKLQKTLERHRMRSASGVLFDPPLRAATGSLGPSASDSRLHLALQLLPAPS
jgi:hypothetical protein